VVSDPSWEKRIKDENGNELKDMSDRCVCIFYPGLTLLIRAAW